MVTRDYAETAYGWALEDTSFVKLVVDPGSRLLLGAHIVGPAAAVLIQPLLQAVMLGQSVDQLAHDVLYIHPALSEVIEQALLEVPAECAYGGAMETSSPDLSRLDTSAAALLAAATAGGASPVQTGTPEQARAAHEAGSPWMSGPGEDVESVAEFDVGGVPVRAYRPSNAGRGVVLYAHGGGWVVGTLDTYDTLCRALANRCGATVVSVGYTLAPECRHPGQVHEVSAVLRHLGAGGVPVAIAGDSAGGHLAAVVAAAAGKEVDLRALTMIYPVIAPFTDSPSRRELATGYMLTTEDMEWYSGHYVPVADAPSDLPLDVRDLDLGSLPPTFVLVAGHDPLRDEGLSFADAVQDAGVPVERVVFPGQLHGFVRATAQIPEAFDALDRVGAFLRERLK